MKINDLPTLAKQKELIMEEIILKKLNAILDKWREIIELEELINFLGDRIDENS